MMGSVENNHVKNCREVENVKTRRGGLCSTIGICFICGEKTELRFKALNLFQCLKCKHESEKEIETRNAKKKEREP